MKKVLSIAGSDSSGGAGIQADIKTMLSNGVYAMSVITSLTAQNTLGVRAVQNADPVFLRQQLDCVFEDIMPDAVKIGMVPGEEMVEVIADRLRFYGASNIVVDPVMAASSGDSLSSRKSVNSLIREILPLATLVTPNIPEAEVLSGIKIYGREDIMQAAQRIYSDCGCSVLIKGGHKEHDSDDMLYHAGEFYSFESKRMENSNTHGTGCTLSSAIASNLAKGMTLPDSVKRAKKYISGAIAAGLDIGHGSGPLDHGYDIKTEYKN